MKNIFFALIIYGLLIGNSLALAQIDEGLMAYYPFNGNANDESSNGNNGIVNGATLTTDRFGNTESAYSFDGLDDHIIIPSFALGGGAISISVWVYVPQVTASFQRILDFGNGPNEYDIVLGWWETSGQMFWETTDVGKTEHLVSKDIFPDNQWVHVVAIDDGQGSMLLGMHKDNNNLLIFDANNCEPGAKLTIAPPYDDPEGCITYT